MVKQSVVAGLTLMLLSGCAHKMSQSECEVANWQDVGFQDGLAGESHKRVRDHQKSCSKFGITLDGTAYEQGYKRGNAQFCQNSAPYTTGSRGELPESNCHGADYKQEYSRGMKQFCQVRDPFKLGLRGESYHNTCDQAFSNQYHQGRDIYSLKQEVQSLKSKRGDLEVKLAKATEDKDKEGLKAELNEVKRKLKSKKRKLDIKLATHAVKSGDVRSILDAL